MAENDAAGVSRPSWRLTLLSAVGIALFAFVVPLIALTLNGVRAAGFPLGFWMTAQGSVLVLVVLAGVFAGRAGGQRAHEGMLPGLAYAGECIGAAGLLGFVGVITALGYDGLAYPLGLAAGLAVATVVIAPRFALYPANALTGFLIARYDSRWACRLALAIMGLATIPILSADLRGMALALQSLSGTDYIAAAAMATVGLVGLWLARALVPARRLAGFIFIVVFCSALASLVSLAFSLGYIPVPQVIYGQALEDLAATEQNLIIKKLADVKSLRPMTSPFLHQSMLNFFAVSLAVAMGAASLPQTLGRHLSQGAVQPGGAARRAARATLWAGLFLTGIPAFATFARVAVDRVFANGMEIAALPASVLEAGRLGWIEICGSTAHAAVDVATSCSKISGTRGFLRLQDVAFANDPYLFTTLLTSGAPALSAAALAVCVLLAGVLVGHALIAGFLGAVGDARKPLGRPSESLDIRNSILVIGLLLSALVLASFSGIDMPSLTSEGLALMASGLFPMLVLGLYWRRMNAHGAVAAMIVGFTVAGFYIAAIRLFPVQMFDWTGGLSIASQAAVRKFGDLKAAADAATDATARSVAQAALYRHAATIAGWWGLQPGAAALFGLPAGFAAGFATSLIFSRRSGASSVRSGPGPA